MQTHSGKEHHSMSDSDQRPAPDAKPKKDSNGGQPRKPESPNSNRTVLYLLIVATICLVFSPLLFTKSDLKTLTSVSSKRGSKTATSTRPTSTISSLV